MAKDSRTPAAGTTSQVAKSGRAEIDSFLEKARALTTAKAADGKRGRLVFAMDATMSRQPTWDIACAIQSEMFTEAAATGGLDIQLVYFRGIGECRASRFVSDAKELGTLMSRIACHGGHTQICRVLAHARKEHETQKVAALVYVGDAMEENLDDLCAAAGELGLLGVRAFMFQEGNDPIAEQAFREMARLSNGAYCKFSPGAAHELAELLRAVAAYAAGGLKALENARRTSGAAKLLAQMK